MTFRASSDIGSTDLRTPKKKAPSIVPAQNVKLAAIGMLGLIVITAGCAPKGDRLSPRRRLALDEESSSSLPDSFAIAGVRRDARGRYVVWSNSGSYMLLYDGGRRTALAREGYIDGVVGADFNRNGRVEAIAVTANGNRRVEFSDSGDVVGVQRLAVPAAPTQAALVDSEWWIGGVAKRGAFVVYRVSRAGHSAEVFRVEPGRGGRDTFPVAAHLSTAGAGALVALIRKPFTIWRVNPKGTVTVESEPLASAAVRKVLTGGGLDWWVSLRAIPLDAAVLQTLADLRSEHRVLVVVDNGGAIANATDLAAPIGFVDSDPVRHAVCAVRTLNVRELVCYRWQWNLR